MKQILTRRRERRVKNRSNCRVKALRRALHKHGGRVSRGQESPEGTGAGGRLGWRCMDYSCNQVFIFL